MVLGSFLCSASQDGLDWGETDSILEDIDYWRVLIENSASLQTAGPSSKPSEPPNLRVSSIPSDLPSIAPSTVPSPSPTISFEPSKFRFILFLDHLMRYIFVSPYEPSTFSLLSILAIVCNFSFMGRRDFRANGSLGKGFQEHSSDLSTYMILKTIAKKLLEEEPVVDVDDEAASLHKVHVA